MHAKYALSTSRRSRKQSESKLVIKTPEIVASRVMPSTTRVRSSLGFNRTKGGKFGRTGFLQKMNVVQLVRGSTSAGGKRFRDVRYTPGELERQLRKSTSSMRMRKEAEIKNYNLADNEVLKKQIQLVRSYDVLPRFVMKKQEGL